MGEVIKSRRGVYYDLSQSPYEYTTPFGDCFKFSSEKKKAMYTRDIVKELQRVDGIIKRHGMGDYLPDEIIQLIQRAVHRSLYRKIEG